MHFLKKMYLAFAAAGYAVLCFPAISSPAPRAELTLATIEHPPHSFVENGEATGAVTEVLRHILVRMGHTPVILSLPPKRALKMIRDGAVDGIYPWTRSPERVEAAFFSASVARVRIIFFKRKSDSIQWNTFSDLRLHTVGGSGGYNYGRAFIETLENAGVRIEYTTSQHPDLNNLRKLKGGRIDLFMCNRDVCGYLMKRHAPEFDGIAPIDIPLSAGKSFHVGFSRKSPDARQIRDEFDRRFDAALKNGALKKIYEKYGMKQDYSRLGSGGGPAENAP